MLKYEVLKDPDGLMIGFDDFGSFNIYAPVKGMIDTLGKAHRPSRSLVIYKNRAKHLSKASQSYKVSKPLVQHLAHLERSYLTLIMRDDFDEWRIPLTWFEGADLKTTGEGVKEFYQVPLTEITGFSIMDPRTRRTGRIWFDGD